MWTKKPGEIDENLMLLGARKNFVYLLKGDRYMLAGGGAQWIVPELETQINEFGIDMDRVQYLLIGHSHYDHCSAVPYLQKKYPHLKILASMEAAKFFAMEKAIKNMRTFSHQTMERMGLPMEFDGASLEFDAVKNIQTLKEGDTIDLGGLKLDVYETPGHSKCSMVMHEPVRKWLFPSDSLCIPVDTGKDFVCTASESFTVFLESLKKLAGLEVRICGWEHCGAMTDEDANDIVRQSIRFTIEYKKSILERLKEMGDEDEAAHSLTKEWMGKAQFDFLPYEVMLFISRTMIKNAAQEEIKESDWL